VHFYGYEKSIYDYDKFDSYTEFHFADYLDVILKKVAAENKPFWVRNQRNVFFEYGSKKYYPDFLLFKDRHFYIVETKGGQGTVKIAIAGVDYSGTYARTSSEQYTSFVNSYAHDNRGNSATASGIGSFFGSNITLMAILTSSSGKGLRCALQGDRSSGTGGGICVDAKNNVYDITYNISGGLF